MYVAITGSIGCGKTTISNILRKQGFIVNDIDGWCRELYYRDDFLEVIKKHFPESFIDNKFNKRVLVSCNVEFSLLNSSHISKRLFEFVSPVIKK